MKNHIVILSLCLIQIIAATVLIHTDEKIVRVRNPKGANGKIYFVDFIGLAQKYGYQAEQHNVTTTDGYILEIFRIPSSPRLTSARRDRKPVVLVNSGILVTSDSWAFFNRSLAYALADAGYDVWFGNYRGNVYGRSHQTLSPEELPFWNYSWHEIGTLDDASTIDYILNLTKASTLSFIAHSMGSTAGFALLSDRPEYNDKVNVFIAMAPAIYWEKIDFFRLTFSNLTCLIKDIADPNRSSEILPSSAVVLNLINNFCKKNNIMDFCFQLISFFLYADPKQLDRNDILELFHYAPAGISSKSFKHFCHLLEDNKFVHYNYGAKNFEHYGQKDPPEYNLRNVRTKTFIIFSENDWVCTKRDIEKIIKHMSINVTVVEIMKSKFTHIDFFLEKNLKILLHNKLIKIISEYAKD